MLNEFKQFISKGNVIDLAVGVIVGGAFTSIVSSLVDDMIMPIIGMILAGVNFKDFGITIPWGNEPFINIGNFIQAIITFLLTAICVFAIVKIINLFYKKAEKPAPKPSKEEELLTEIRDLLKAQNSSIVEIDTNTEETKSE
ncbi:MAG: large-conductance mechanosensitive channel protein MscL [Oscillospiraceae bacterium]|nr:large-conductance mechanosensitive channel protein MscL [Oscillospiraceae bacterium]